MKNVFVFDAIVQMIKIILLFSENYLHSAFQGEPGFHIAFLHRMCILQRHMNRTMHLQISITFQ